MPEYRYRAKDFHGVNHNGTLMASSVEMVDQMMKQNTWILLSVKEVQHRNVGDILGQWSRRVSTKQVVVFSRQLAVLVSANVPIVRALHILAKQTKSIYFVSVIRAIGNDVSGGARLSTAMQKYQSIFDDFFVYMIRAGETTGRLDEVLTYLADQKEKDYELRSQILISLIYPAFILVVLLVTFVAMMIFVVPKLTSVLIASGTELPLVTRILITTADFAQHSWLLLLGVVIVITGGIVLARRTAAGRAVMDRMKLFSPIVGRIFMKIYLTRIARSLSNLLAAGVPVNKSITIVGDVVGNVVFRKLLLSASVDIEAGITISDSLARHQLFIPPMMVQMIAIGEETGRLDYLLAKIAEFYDREVQSLMRALVSLVEPTIIILLGIGATIIVTGILLPIYSVTTTV